MRTVGRFLARTVAWMVILAAGAVILAAVIVPRLTGATPYTIITSSMEPTYPPGTLVVVRPVDPSELSVGDVVTVQLESGEETVVTHRIVAIQHRADGNIQFITKGDANDTPDADPRMPIQIRGEVWYYIPFIGYVSTAVSGSQRGVIVTLIAIALIGYAVWMFVSGYRERRSGDKDTKDEKPGDGDRTTPDGEESEREHEGPQRAVEEPERAVDVPAQAVEEPQRAVEEPTREIDAQAIVES